MKSFVVLAAAGLLGGWSPAAAQSSPPSPSLPVVSSSLVVTASLEPAAADELAATVDVVDADELARRQADLALDALRLVPGVAAAQAGSPGKAASLFVRGAASAQTLVLLDGVALNDPVLGGFDWSSVATDGLDRIEVARGPFSAQWGSQAMGGVVHLVTRRGGGRAGGLALEGGSDDQARAGGYVTLPFAPFAFDAAASVRRGDGQLANDFFDAHEARARLDWTAGDGVRVGLLARVADAEIGLPYDFFGVPSPARRQESDSTLVALPVDWTRPSFALETQLARHDGDLALADPNDPFAASDSETTREQARVVARGRLGERWRLAGGADYDRQEATTATAFGPGLASERQSNRALFAEASYAAGRLRVDAGARRDEQSEFGGETSARAGAVVDLGRGGRLRASWGESFRAPALGDLFFPFFGNPDLEPERGESWEVGWELARGAWSGRLAGFGSDFENLIQYDPISFLPQNVGRARARGVEASLGWRGREVAARLDATWLDSEDLATGAPLPRRPEESAALVVDWRRDRWSAGAALRYVGAREDTGRIELPSYAATDLTAAWEASERWRPYARVENLFDRDYEEVAGFPAPGRSWMVGLSFRSGG
jgi:vitamin B12 transporter